MAWMASRDIYTALILTAIFIVLSEYLFNEDSSLCVVPYKHRILHKLKAADLKAADVNQDGIVTEDELINAISILEKAKKEKQQQIHHDAHTKYKDLEHPNQIQTN